MANARRAPDGGRRSRRGFYYQDLHTLRCCLRACRGEWDEVTPEAGEDVACRRHDPAGLEYTQVKTREFAHQMWSEAQLCDEEVSGCPNTSILGRLFTGKPLPDEVTFRLVTNIGVNAYLRPLLVIGPGGDRGPVALNLEQRVAGLEPEDGRSIAWCLDRFWIEASEGTVDGLEALTLFELESVCAEFGLALLPEERELLFAYLMARTQAAARDEPPTTLTRQAMADLVSVGATRARQQVDNDMDPQTPALQEKLRLAGFAEEEIEGATRARFGFSRERRSAVGRRADELDRLCDEIAMACLQVHARRELGDVASGMPSFLAVTQEIQVLHAAGRWQERDVPLGLAWGALHDVTGRCQNRYV